jgi:flagellar biosynthesis chaperone FliJ
MKNYRALAKLRKQQFDRAEQALAMANARLNRLYEKKESLRADERAVEPPVKGKGLQLGGVLSQKRAIKRALEALELEIEAARREKAERERQLKAAHIAWEQARSIESHALKILMEKEKRATQSRLDEIASQRFWRERNAWKEGEG